MCEYYIILFYCILLFKYIYRLVIYTYILNKRQTKWMRRKYCSIKVKGLMMRSKFIATKTLLKCAARGYGIRCDAFACYIELWKRTEPEVNVTLNIINA